VAERVWIGMQSPPEWLGGRKTARWQWLTLASGASSKLRAISARL
jgi:hypothetical protein